MSENWYALEHHVRERIADAQAIARSQSVARDFTVRQRRPHSIGLIQRAGKVLASAVAMKKYVLQRRANPETLHTEEWTCDTN